MFIRTIGWRVVKPFIVCALSFTVPLAVAQTPVASEGDSHPKPNADAPASSSEIEQLRQMILQQQRQIDELKRTAAEQKSQDLQKNQDSTATAKPDASAPSASSRGIGEVASTTPILPPLPAAATLPAVVPPPQAARPASSSTADAVADLEKKLSDLAFGKVKIGGTFYGFYSVFPQTGFGPQTLDNTDIYPGPGNNGYNEFNINRTYINILYTPTDAITLRFTPNVYREVGAATAQKLGATSGAGASINGNLSFRLKYAYFDLNKLFSKSKAFGKDKLTFGQTQQPLTDWEENLYGYRFVNLTQWNMLSLSSTYIGVKLHGPIQFNGKQYIDYDIGVFNASSYHAYEIGERKQVMARVSFFPFGAESQFQGLGLTAFGNYGYKDVAIDQLTNVPITRLAFLAHYQSKSNDYGIAGEWDWGRNAFSAGNLFSGSGPNDFFGLGATQYAAFNSMTAAILSGTHTRQSGYSIFGHARIGKSPFYLFGTLDGFKPNTQVSNDPIDFRTVIGGISYHFGKNWQFAVDSKNIVYSHSQFTFPASALSGLSSGLASQYPNGIANAVPQDTNQVSFNVLFNY